jgi:hypothetical protein
LLVRAFHLDRRYRRLNWSDNDFLSSDTDFKSEKKRACQSIFEGIEHARAILDRFLDIRRTMYSPAGFLIWKLVVYVVVQTAIYNNAVAMKTSKQTMQFVKIREMKRVQRQQKRRQNESDLNLAPNSDPMVFESECSKLHSSITKSLEVKAAEVRTKRSFASHVLVFMKAFHPWYAVEMHNIQSPCAVRALCQMIKIFGAMFVSALFFSASGGAMDKSSDPECSPEGFWASARRNIAVGIISTLISSIPLFVLLRLHQREIIVLESDKAKKKILRRWCVQDGVLWIVGVAYAVLCVLFVASFLANVTSKDSLKWLLSAITSIIKTALVIPLLLACFFAFCFANASKLPGIQDEVHAGNPNKGSSGTSIDAQEEEAENRESPESASPDVLASSESSTTSMSAAPDEDGTRRTRSLYPWASCVEGVDHDGSEVDI